MPDNTAQPSVNFHKAHRVSLSDGGGPISLYADLGRSSQSATDYDAININTHLNAYSSQLDDNAR